MGGLISKTFSSFIRFFGLRRIYSTFEMIQYTRINHAQKSSEDCEAFILKSEIDATFSYEPIKEDSDNTTRDVNLVRVIHSDIQNKNIAQINRCDATSVELNQKPELKENEHRKNPQDQFRNQDISESFPQTKPNSNIKICTNQQMSARSKCLASILAGTNLIEYNKYASCEFDWDDNHLKVLPGLNVLAMCKSSDCKFYLKDVICPKGLYPDRHGNCSLDREIHMVNCPKCKQNIRPDNSFGFCFFECKFELSYKLDNGEKGKIEKKASNNIIVSAKCCSYLNGRLRYLELRIFN